MRTGAWEVEAGGRSFRFKPLKVRERMRLAEQLADERAKQAATDAKLVGMSVSQSAEHVADERRKAMGAQQILLDCYTIKGALRVLAESCGGEDAIAYADAVEPAQLTGTALEALGIDLEERAKESSQGNG